jgi:HSP20 family protein
MEVKEMAITDILPWNRGEERSAVERAPERNEMVTLRDEMDRLFDRFLSDPFGMSPFDGWREMAGRFSPRVDVNETDEAIQVSAELPGMDRDDIEVSVTKDMLTLSGEKRTETEWKEKQARYMERSYGSFRRTIPLPAEVEVDRVEATFEKGVLRIELPKSPEERRRTKRISVKKA